MQSTAPKISWGVSEMKYKIAMHDDHKLPGYLTRTLIVTGKVDKYGMFKSGVIHAQTFGKTVGDAENMAEKIIELLNTKKETT